MSVCVERKKARMDYKQSLSHNGPCKKPGVISSCLHNAAPYWQIRNTLHLLWLLIFFFVNLQIVHSCKDNLYMNTAIMMKDKDAQWKIKMLFFIFVIFNHCCLVYWKVNGIEKWHKPDSELHWPHKRLRTMCQSMWTTHQTPFTRHMADFFSMIFSFGQENLFLSMLFHSSLFWQCLSED